MEHHGVESGHLRRASIVAIFDHVAPLSLKDWGSGLGGLLFTIVDRLDRCQLFGVLQIQRCIVWIVGSRLVFGGGSALFSDFPTYGTSA